MLCFNKFKRLHNLKYNEIVYVGDNINKDFIETKKVGIRTIQVIRKDSIYKDVIRSEEYHAEYIVSNLCEIKEIDFFRSE